MNSNNLTILTTFFLAIGAATIIHGQDLICGNDSSKTSSYCRQFDNPKCGSPQGDRADGCSIPEGIPGRDSLKAIFRNACDEHDVCYSSRGVEKSQCDAYFRKNMLATCKFMKDTDHPDYVPACGFYVSQIYTAVKADPTGDAEYGFTQGQIFAWSKCPPCDPTKSAYVRLIEHRTFSGETRTIKEGKNVKNLRDLDFTDEASSAIACIPKGRTARLWQHDSYKGRSVKIKGTGKAQAIYLEKDGFGDEISSVSWE